MPPAAASINQGVANSTSYEQTVLGARVGFGDESPDNFGRDVLMGTFSYL